MTKPVLLDAGPLGQLAHPKPKPEVREWFRRVLGLGIELVVPEITDYEVRRNLLLEGKSASVRRLDDLKAALRYQPITSSIMLKAAELWASARRQGRPTADPHALDGDVILAAQALEAGAIVATENVGHLSRYVTAVDWRLIVPPPP